MIIDGIGLEHLVQAFEKVRPGRVDGPVVMYLFKYMSNIVVIWLQVIVVKLDSGMSISN